MEIERKWLIPSETLIPLDSVTSSSHITQGYFLDDERVEGRVRIRTDIRGKGEIRRKNETEYCLVFKSANKSLTRMEHNHAVTKELAIYVLRCCDNIISKTRHIIPLMTDLKIEVDVFDNSPLILAEIEFPDEATAKAFKEPTWFGEEVTGNPEYYNSNLAKTIGDSSDNLVKMTYEVYKNKPCKYKGTVDAYVAGYQNHYLILGFKDEQGCIKQFSDRVVYNSKDYKSFRFAKIKHVEILEGYEDN